jgi:hypothetical protein
MEIDILKTVRFDLGVPLCYTFLRRYAKCVHADMKFLTLASKLRKPFSSIFINPI